MMIEVKLPETSEEVQESVIVLWNKEVGDEVDQEEVLVEVQTEKAVFEIEAPAAGIIQDIFVQRGEVAAVGDVLATIKPDNEVADGQTKTNETRTNDNDTNETGSTAEETSSSTHSASPVQNGRRFVKASPRIRRLAKELNVDLAIIQGTGPQGRPTEDDIRQSAQKEQMITQEEEKTAQDQKEEDSKPETETTLHMDMSPIRQTIARRMKESLQEMAQLTETTWADVTILNKKRKEGSSALSWNDWILYATTKALLQHPEVNATLANQHIKQFQHVHLGIAVDTEKGLTVPVIQHAEQLSLQQLHEKASSLVEKAHQQRLTSADVQNGTFTVTNLGSFGIQFFTPIINPPQAAILGVGRIEPHLIMSENKIEQKYRLPLSFTFDHRLLDGATAAKFLQTMIEILENPEKHMFKE